MPDIPVLERFRLFLAIRIPEAVKSEIQRVEDELRRALAHAEVRWTRREQFHVTLRFLGSVEVRYLDSLTDALRQACRPFSPLGLRAEGLGFFPAVRSPRVAWVGVQDAQGQLPTLQKALQTVCSGFSAEAPEEKFTGHVTLARIKSMKPKEARTLGGLVAAFGSKCFGEWTAHEVDLMRSELSAQGARHSVLEAIPLPNKAASEG